MHYRRPEVSCENCAAACCHDILTNLTAYEAERLRAAGTILMTIVPPMDESVSEPAWQLHPIKMRRMLRRTFQDRQERKHMRGRAERLGAGKGLYEMIGKCAFLDENGRCTTYDDRPDVCPSFEEGGSDCLKIRERRGIPLPTEVQVELIRPPEAD